MSLNRECRPNSISSTLIIEEPDELGPAPISDLTLECPTLDSDEGPMAILQHADIGRPPTPTTGPEGKHDPR
jgi:hypothetical protein